MLLTRPALFGWRIGWDVCVYVSLAHPRLNPPPFPHRPPCTNRWCTATSPTEPGAIVDWLVWSACLLCLGIRLVFRLVGVGLDWQSSLVRPAGNPADVKPTGIPVGGSRGSNWHSGWGFAWVQLAFRLGVRVGPTGIPVEGQSTDRHSG